MSKFQLKHPISFKVFFGLLLNASILLCLSSSTQAAAYEDLLAVYTSEGASAFSAEHGKELWNKKHTAKDGGKSRSCSVCHTSNINNSGKHIKTGKVIKPMAVASNQERLTKTRKMKKWLRRNCKWVMGRVCTAQEKGDILTFIRNF